MELKRILSIAVCTFNRPHLLKECIDSILSNDLIEEVHQVLVIDNGSIPLSKREFSFPDKVVLYREDKEGLSYARNTALKKCVSPWIAFVDDDSIVEEDFISQALSMLDQGFAAFGGSYIPWYKEEKKSWFKDQWASSTLLRPDIGALPEGTFFPGGVSVWHVQKALEAGAFPLTIGMAGERVSYGEEVLLQRRLLEDGFKLGYNPDLQIRHFVSQQKMSLVWLLKSAYSKGRDSWAFQNEEPTWWLWIKIFIKSHLELGIHFLSNLLCFIQRKELHFQTVLASSLIPYAYGLGRLAAKRNLE